MSSIEERLVRDIAAVTGGVVVTESELRVAREEVDARIGSRRHEGRRRAGVAAAAAAVLVLVLGVTAFLTLGGEDESAPPAEPGPTQDVDSHADFLTGSGPTSELVEGVWRLDNGGVLMRFAPPDLVSFDVDGRLFENPGVQGRYAIDGDLISVSVDGGPAGCGGQQFAMRASLPDQGAMHLVHTQPGTGACSRAQDERWVMEQVLPMSPSFADFVLSTETGWQPLSDKSALYGSWFAEGGEHVLELDRNGEYHVAGGSGEQVDYGEWSLRGSRLTLTSWPDSTTCDAFDRLLLGAVEYVDPGTTAIRSTVRENTCHAPWAEAVWILIPHDGN
jgi:hypothetical protein